MNIIAKLGEARDPWVFYYKGFYYHCFTHDNEIFLRKSKTLENLINGELFSIYKPTEKDVTCNQEIWAPELHIIDNKCYVYFTADDGNNDNHRIYVLINNSNDPLAKYTLYGKITPKTDRWAIDATFFKYNNKMYLIWSGWEGFENVCQNLYIAEMSDPVTFKTDRFLLSTPEYMWEKRWRIDDKECNLIVNEGPAVIQKNNRLFVVYSGASCDSDNYCLGMLEFKGGEVLDKNNWIKENKPVFAKTENAKGPGHCSIFNDGKSDYLCYHLFQDDCTRGWYYVNAVAQTFNFVDDKPVFGKPEYNKNKDNI